MWKNFFGTIGARSRAAASVAALARLGGAAAGEVAAHVGHVEADDLVALDPPDLAAVVADELHPATPQTLHRGESIDAGGRDEPGDVEVLAVGRVEQAGRGAVVDGRDRRRALSAEASEYQRVTSRLGRRAEDLAVGALERGDERVGGVDARRPAAVT